MSPAQVVSKHRVATHGEVLTDSREVNASYTGINKHEDEDNIDLYDTVLSRADAEKIYTNAPLAATSGRFERAVAGVSREI